MVQCETMDAGLLAVPSFLQKAACTSNNIYASYGAHKEAYVHVLLEPCGRKDSRLTESIVLTPGKVTDSAP